jgi:hypothetical protein
MEKTQDRGGRFINPLLLYALLILLLPLSALFLGESYSFLHFFEALDGQTRVAAPLIAAFCFALFCLAQLASAALLAEGLLFKSSKIAPFFAGALAVGSAVISLYLLCDAFLPGQALMALSFLPGGMLMASSYKSADHKTVTILKASFGSFTVLVMAMLCSAVFFEGGFAQFFAGLIDRIKALIALFCDDLVEQMVVSAGGMEAFEQLLISSGVDLSAENLTVELLLAEYRETLYFAATGALLLAPSVLFCLYTCCYYLAYALFRGLRRLCGDRARKPLLMSPFAAGVYVLCVVLYSFWSMFIGGGGVVILLVINLVVMLTPGLAVMGAKCIWPLMVRAFKQNKITGIFCLLLILINPVMVLAASGCYGIIGSYLKERMERRSKR